MFCLFPLAAGLMLAGGCATPGQPPAVAAGPFTPAQETAMREAGFIKSDRGWELSVSDRLLFATDQAEVLPGQASIIERMTRALVDVGIAHLEVEGHTDRTGSARHNDLLSAKRAEAVAGVIAANGMERANIKTVGLGQRYPVESNATAAGRRENRRVVILVTAP